MTLTIHKLNTDCRASKTFAHAGTLVDDASRSLLASELSGQLGPSLDRLPAVVRLRSLQVKVRLPARRLDATKLAQAWAREFATALHRALAYADGEGTSAVHRYSTQAEYRAALLQYLLTEGASSTWRFPEVDEWSGQSAAQASHEFLLRDRTQISETFTQLGRNRWLEPLLGSWDDIRMEQLMRVISETEAVDRGLTLNWLIELARLAAASGGLHPQWSVASRRQAVRLWSCLSGRFGVRSIWHGLRLLVRLLEQPTLLTRADTTLLVDPVPFPQWCETVVCEAAARHGAVAGPSGSTPTSLHPTLAGIVGSAPSSLDRVLADLRPLVPSAASAGQRGRWVSSECCGVLLLLSAVRRMDLWRLTQEPEFVRFGGPRAFSFLLAAAGMTLLGDWEPTIRLETAVALFAGIFSEVDYAGLKQFLAEADVRSVPVLLPGTTWTESLQNLATEFCRAFAQRIRGFRQSSREAVIKQFIRMPGRVLVEEQRLLVVLEPSPWSVALHISGMDESLENLEWLGRRRVEFVLEGL